MKLSIDPNGWVIHIDDLDVFNISRDQAELLKKIPYTNLLTVIHNKSKLTLDQYHHFAQQIFEGLNNDLPAKEKVFVEGTNKEVIRVTGRKDDNGEMLGLFGMKDNLPWHCNEPGRIAHERPDALCLYAVEHTKGSATLFSNSILALKDLRESTNAPAGLLENLDKIYCFYDYQGSTDNGPTASDVNYRGRTGFNKLVNHNKSGLEGIHWSPMQYPQFYVDQQPVSRRQQILWHHYLLDFLTQSKYCYSQNWVDNEIIINCQWISMHARAPFEQIQDRLLWRIMGYTLPFDASDVVTNNLGVYNYESIH